MKTGVNNTIQSIRTSRSNLINIELKVQLTRANICLFFNSSECVFDKMPFKNVTVQLPSDLTHEHV